MRNGLLAVAFAILAVVAAAGWARKAPAQNDTMQPYAQASYLPPGVNQNTTPCADNNVAFQSASYSSSPYTGDVFVHRTHRPVRVVRREAVEESADRDVSYSRQHGRSTGKSVAIVAGTAATGAAVGALAGGGKGAAIGALTGGAGGFVYDRLTHNR
jgi:hypothetical protein